MVAKHPNQDRIEALERLDEQLLKFLIAYPGKPRKGWIAFLRQALGMSGVQLARRMGISPSAVKRLQEREVEQTVTLASLSRAADAMEAVLLYALVPKSDFAATVRERARFMARAEVEREAVQETDLAAPFALVRAARAEDLYQRLVRDWPKELWDDSDDRGAT